LPEWTGRRRAQPDLFWLNGTTPETVSSHYFADRLSRELAFWPLSQAIGP
jgi:hypothetical protein